MSKRFYRTSRKNTLRAKQMRKTRTMKMQMKAYLRKNPGVTEASKKFGIPEKKIYQWIYASR